VACNFEWSRCTTGGHNDITDSKYIDCKRCPDHPGGPPASGGFWGSQPDEVDYVSTADELSIPWPETTYGSQSKAKETRHSRVDSGSSEDPLQWSKERYETEMTKLATGFGKSTISDKAKSAWSAWSWNNERWERYNGDSYKYEYKECSTDWSDWTWDSQNSQYYSVAEDPDGNLYYIYSRTYQESSSMAPELASHKGKEKEKGKGDGKAKAKGKEKGKGKGSK